MAPLQTLGHVRMPRPMVHDQYHSGREGGREGGLAIGTYVFSYSNETLQVKIWHLSKLFGMSGCLAPWSITSPRTNRLSLPSLCVMCIISTICKSIGCCPCPWPCPPSLPASPSPPPWARVRTASVTASVILSAISSASLVRREVRAMDNSNSLSFRMLGCCTCARKGGREEGREGGHE